jgi:hypothetical protein
MVTEYVVSNSTEYVVVDSIVVNLFIKDPGPPATSSGVVPWFRILYKLLGKVCSPPPDEVRFFEGRAYAPQTVRKVDLSGFLRGAGHVRITHGSHRRIRT